ncbi:MULTISPECIES: hemolysin family protein [Escherichia]|uniref:Polyamine export protein n=2 Tax=Escherichia fergusonii TaxID=564 RepID=B7LM06_ESCF3|nr:MULTISPECIES: hemolysin family protein [Escherichia]AXM03922.1 HlyC/CorC family transporter [Escherichia fergusonii]EFF0768568.1 HlyC/CorC family transporter [Escherichia fergusonii]EFL4481075.1 HlyC/CorC family transporter [Escherichia fergusonii]EFL4494037.1 HlyC/CorC family transporter [Escherichia fergusonii]EFL4508666.1 HlyC/CorC family transporter [Escherichia fergusonii]
MLNSIFVILCLIAVSAFFSISEISLAASRKIKLKLLADEGNINAQRVLDMQANPGMFFTVVQIGLNAVAILGGIVGDAAFSPAFHSLFSSYMPEELSEQLSFILSFSLVTGLFILFADLTPKRIGMVAPEAVALRIINPMRFCLFVFTPLVWFFNGLANIIFRIFKLPMVRKDDITSDDIYAVVEAGALAGVLRKQEHELIENVFELESRTVPSSMTPRENVVWFDLHEDEQSLKNKVAEHPHSKFLVCNEDIDHIIGYVDSKDLLNRVLANQSLALNSGVQIRNTLIVPDTLTLSEALESFKAAGEDFAVIMNEYALVVGIITLNDVMTTLMGDLVGQGLEEQIVARDENSWLIDGGTPIDDVMRVLDIDEFPQSDNYETIGGFMMFMLRKIPKRTDSVKFSGYKFEVVDIDNYRIDQLLVTRIDNKATALSPKLPDAKDKEESVA